MKIVALAVLLTVMQASQPVPRKTADDSAKAPANVQNESKSSHTKSLPASAPIKTDSNRPSKGDSDNPHSEDAGHYIGISKLPAVTVVPQHPGLLEWTGIGFNGLLVAVGFLQALLLCFTLRFIRRQAHEMKRQRAYMGLQWKSMRQQVAEMEKQTVHLENSVAATITSAGAAKNSVDLVINKERARIRAGRPEPLVLTNIGMAMKVELRLFFHVPTPAFRVASVVCTVLSDSLDSYEKKYTHGLYPLPNFISTSDTPEPFKDFMMNPFPLDKLTVDSILQGAVYVRFCGLIKYLDFFDRQRETAFHFRWNAPNISMNALRSYAFPEGWVEVGGDKENYCT